MKYTIKNLAEGKCYLLNDGTLEELTTVLTKAFPRCRTKIHGHSKYYFRDERYNKDNWNSATVCEPLYSIQSVKDFLTPPFENGEEIEVFTDSAGWYRTIFIGLMPNGDFVACGLKNSTFPATYQQARKITNITELTLQQIADKFDIPISNLKIVDNNK